jgi:hypothetical protein
MVALVKASLTIETGIRDMTLPVFLETLKPKVR